MTTITTGSDGEALFNGVSIHNIIVNADELSALWKEIDGDISNVFALAAAALRHLSAQPDPLAVTGRLRWEEIPLAPIGEHINALYMGRVLCGKTWRSAKSGSWRATYYLGIPSHTVFHPTEEARAALVQAVKEAIGG